MVLRNIRAGVLSKCSAGNYDLPAIFDLEDISVNRQHLAIRNIDRSAISIKHHALCTVGGSLNCSIYSSNTSAYIYR